MSKYEYKDTIQDSIIHYYDHVLLYREYTDDVLDELDHVYAQAAKADEYEAKAKAWDLLTEDINFIESEIEEIGLSQMLAVKTIGIKALKRKNECESGESNV